MNFYEQIDSNKRKSVFLIIFFMLFIGAVAWVFTAAMGMQGDESIGFLGIFGIFAVGFALFSYFLGAKTALVATGAKEVPREGEYKEVHRIVENLAITAGLPKPKVCVIDDPSPNAFATGRNQIWEEVHFRSCSWLEGVKFLKIKKFRSIFG